MMERKTKPSRRCCDGFWITLLHSPPSSLHFSVYHCVPHSAATTEKKNIIRLHLTSPFFCSCVAWQQMMLNVSASFFLHIYNLFLSVCLLMWEQGGFLLPLTPCVVLTWWICLSPYVCGWGRKESADMRSLLQTEDETKLNAVKALSLW